MENDELVFGAVGVAPFDERVYRTVLAGPPVTVRDLAERTGSGAERLQSALARLRGHGLVSRLSGRPTRWAAVSPTAALAALVRNAHADLGRVTETAAELEAVYRALGETARPGEGVEVLTSADELGRWFARLQQEATEEIMSLDRPPYVLAHGNPLQHTLLGRGVRYRTIYAPESLEIPGNLDDVAGLSQAGEEARVLAGLPLKMSVADRRIALLPLHLDSPITRSVVIRGTTLVDALVTLFEGLWTQAVPLTAAGSESRGDPLDAEDRRILNLLLSGLKDETIARQLGTSTRSLRRRMRAILDELGAENRFQAGVQAVRRGWV
ncbi:helix-turn-helix domain-containing protein [Embleya hyalina]|uniref:Transcriptional regulator n=1 Tax=Embleya hyalina TaxID=516124 RepID=A0A401Z6N8_9ACTN|nr:helix-turn-helix domain-containing protein [Embleya hyalina]GCE02530.1 transcriptional regulator [Embleya hyalina]